MKTIAAAGTALCLAFAVTAAAQRGPQPEAPPDSPSWAYGVPNTPVNRPPGERPAPDTSVKHIPGTDQGMTLQHIRDYWDVGDWFPNDHPPMPNVVVHGRQPHVRGCAMCHMPEGKGRPENAPVAGLPVSYFVQQLKDFKNGLRTSADPRKLNTQQMIEGAQDMTEEEMQEAAKYFGSMTWTHWITVKEAAMVPKTRITGNVFFPLPGGETEPIGDRIIETPEDGDRFELRDPHSGFIAYVPPGSIKKGEALVTNGGNGKTVGCALCHGEGLKGLGDVPRIAGIHPIYIVRQLFDFQSGSNTSTAGALMKKVVANLTEDDMVAIAAYTATLEP